MVTKITTHEADALKRLLIQYKGQPNFENFFKCFTTQVQGLEDVIYSLLELLDIDLMIGAQLDLIGRIVGQPRNDMTDTLYRIFLKARIGVNTSEGNFVCVNSVFRLLLAGVEGDIWECFPAEVQLFVSGTISATIETYMTSIMQDMVGAGIKVWGIKYPSDTFVLGWYGEPDPVWLGKGLSWDTNLDQGKLSWTLP